MRTLVTCLKDAENAVICGRVDRVRKMGGLSFIDLQDRSGAVQVVLDAGVIGDKDIRRYDVLRVAGELVVSPQVRTGIPGKEFKAKSFEYLGRPVEPYPLPVGVKSQVSIGVELDNRAISLRNPRNAIIFGVQADIAASFAAYLRDEGFVQMFSSKIVSQGGEGGANMFCLDYMGRPAFLAQSPQLYKQMLVGTGIERVFEIGHVYRAEPHDTARHLNEYVSLDLEMAYIEGVGDVMDVEEGLIKRVLVDLKERRGPAMKEVFGAEVSVPQKIPRVSFNDALEIIKSKYGFRGDDMDATAERLITAYAQKESGSDLVFITHYPRSKRPFYTMPSSDPSLSESFDLVYRGLEITSGSQRIHEYGALVENIKTQGISTRGLEGYLQAFKCGMPPHGGLGIGLERLTARVLGVENVKLCSLFPRDVNRIDP